jgi:hypothetical protein
MKKKEVLVLIYALKIVTRISNRTKLLSQEFNPDTTIIVTD